MDQQLLTSLLSYDCQSGIFTWKVGNRSGMQAGYKHPHGYVQIWIKGKPYYAHRLAWLYVYGKEPSQHIDHIDGVKNNNSILNLRDCDRSTNMLNQHKAHKNSESGLIGVKKDGIKWRARIKAAGREFHLGSFDNKELAVDAYMKAKAKLNAGLSLK